MVASCSAAWAAQAQTSSGEGVAPAFVAVPRPEGMLQSARLCLLAPRTLAV